MSTEGAQTALVVDCDVLVVAKLGSIVDAAGYSVVGLTQFEAARKQVTTTPTSLLVANMRLAEFNGVHLAYLTRSTNRHARMVIYAQSHDPILAREAQNAGAFYERWEFLTHALPAWLAAALPEGDRRGSACQQRRAAFRGGRRVIDRPELYRT